MTRHLNNDAERMAAVKRTKQSVTVILIMVLVVLAYTVYQFIK